MVVVWLILVAVVLVHLAVKAAVSDRTNTPIQPPPVNDPAAPYREGLHAAIQVQRVAQDLEQQIYAAAAQHMDGNGRE